MSEYQYYEFQAIDRPLTRKEMDEVRSLSTRATITSSRFVNVYHWGSFKGDPLTLMQEYYDAFMYVANWGTHTLMLRLPKQSLPPDVAARYCVDEDFFWPHESGERLVLVFDSATDDGEYWDEEDEWEDRLSQLAQLRTDIAGGDLRSLYLGWLLCLQADILDDDTQEPPVPPGLGDLSQELQGLAEFLRIEDDLLQAAAERSGPRIDPIPSRSDALRWIGGLSEAEKDEFLLGMALGAAQPAQGELRRRIRESLALASPADDRRRTVAELLAAADARKREKERRAAEKRERRRMEQAVAQERQRMEQAAAREAYLDGIAGKVEEIWTKVASLVGARTPVHYAEAVRVLMDLRDLAARNDTHGDFRARLTHLRALHARKTSFISCLDQAGFGG